MHTTTIIRFDENDAINWSRRLDEAFNRVINFAPEILYTPAMLKSRERVIFNKIVDNREFSREDWRNFVAYASEVVRRIGTKVHSQTYQEADPALVAAIVQAQTNLVEVMTELDLAIEKLF